MNMGVFMSHLIADQLPRPWWVLSLHQREACRCTPSPQPWQGDIVKAMGSDSRHRWTELTLESRTCGYYSLPKAAKALRPEIVMSLS